MPFTICHAAAVLPLKGIKRLSLWAMMVGTFAPDFAYFVPWLGTPGNISHSYSEGALVAIIPSLLLIGIGFLLREALETVAGIRIVRSRASLGNLVCSIILGVWSHVLWDSFTHRNGAMVDLVHVLRTPIGGLPMYVLLQHASSAVGLLILSIAFVVRWGWPTLQLVAFGTACAMAGVIWTVASRVSLSDGAFVCITSFVRGAGLFAFGSLFVIKLGLLRAGMAIKEKDANSLNVRAAGS